MNADDSAEEVFTRLYDEHWAPVRRHLECYLGDDADVDDVLQAVFLVAWRKFRPRHPMRLAWLLRTADNLLRDRARHEDAQDKLMVAVMTKIASHPDHLDPAGEVAARAGYVALRAAFDALSPHERRLVGLTYWDDLSAGEIAEITHTTQGAVWVTLSRARHKMRRALDESGGVAREL